MAADIDRIVTVTISRQTSVPSIASFQGLMLAAEFLISSFSGTGYGSGFTGRAAVFGSLSELAAAIGTGYATHILYYMATAAFAQNPSISQVYVGRKKTGADGTETWTTALTAIALENNAWYGLAIGSRVLADQEEVAAWTEANTKLFGIGSSDANCVDGTGDIAAYLDSHNYTRSWAFYNAGATGTPSTDTWPEIRLFGLQLPKDPGASTWAFKTPAGIVASALTTAQINTLTGKNGNFFGDISGTDVMQFGTVGTGEYIDVIQGLDWLTALIQQYVFTPILQMEKVPFTNQGIQTVVSQLTAALQKGVDKGLLAALSKDSVQYPDIADVAPADKADRLLPDVKFTVTLAGAIHKVQIAGVVLI